MAQVMQYVAFKRGYPTYIKIDNGSEFISKALDDAKLKLKHGVGSIMRVVPIHLWTG